MLLGDSMTHLDFCYQWLSTQDVLRGDVRGGFGMGLETHWSPVAQVAVPDCHSLRSSFPVSLSIQPSEVSCGGSFVQVA